MGFTFGLCFQNNIVPPPKGIATGRKSGVSCHIFETMVYPLSKKMNRNKSFFSSYSPLSLPKESPDQLKQTEGSQLQGCKQTAFTAQTIGNTKKLWKSARHKRISLDTPVLGLGQKQKCSQGQQRTFPLFNSAFHLRLNDRRCCSSNYFPLGPTQATLQQFLCSPAAALPKPCRREKAQKGMFVARLSPISQNENNDWPFLWASLEKTSYIVGWDGEEVFGQWIKFQPGIFRDPNWLWPT